MSAKKIAFSYAFPHTLPILAGFLVLGSSYGFLMSRFGFPFYYPLLMSIFIFAGSMEIMTISLLLAPFDPLAAFLLTLLVNGRHLLYGIPLLEKYQNSGWKKGYLIYALCDETFSITSTVEVPKEVDKSWFFFFITLLIQGYWVFSATLGSILGNIIKFELPGLDFVLTALFVVLLVDQFMKSQHRLSALIGLGFSLVCLLLFGPTLFMLPATSLILLFFYLRFKTKGVKDE